MADAPKAPGDEEPRPDEAPPGPTTWEDELHGLLSAVLKGLDELGLASVKLRWRIHHWQEDLIARRQARLQPRDPRTIPRNCPSCGLVAGAGVSHCPHCKRPMSGAGAMWGQIRRSMANLRNEAGDISALQLLMRVEIGWHVLTIALSTPELGPRAVFRSSSKVLGMLGAYLGPFVADGQLWRLVTTLFLHGGLMHAVFNLMALLQLGMATEAIYGRHRFIVIFLMAGLSGDLAGWLWNGPGVASVGASGAIFGLLGALFVFTRLHGGPRAAQFGELVRRWIVIGILFGVMANGLGGMAGGGVRIDNAAHIGGLVGGAAVALVMGDPRGVSRESGLWRAMGAAAWVTIAACLLMGLRFTALVMGQG